LYDNETWSSLRANRGTNRNLISEEIQNADVQVLRADSYKAFCRSSNNILIKITPKYYIKSKHRFYFLALCIYTTFNPRNIW